MTGEVDGRERLDRVRNPAGERIRVQPPREIEDDDRS